MANRDRPGNRTDIDGEETSPGDSGQVGSPAQPLAIVSFISSMVIGLPEFRASFLRPMIDRVLGLKMNSPFSPSPKRTRPPGFRPSFFLTAA